MNIDWNDELRGQLEWHWEHQLRPRLAGLTDDEYFWSRPRLLEHPTARREHGPISVGGGAFTMDYAMPRTKRSR